MPDINSLLTQGDKRRPMLLELNARPLEPPAALPFSDTFVRGGYGTLDGSSLTGGGSTWNVTGDTVNTASPGYAALASTNSSSPFFTDDNIGSANHSVSGTFDQGTSGSEGYVQCSVTDSNNAYFCGFILDGGTWYLFLAKIVGGSFTPLDDASIGGSPPPDGTVITLTRDGTSVSASHSSGSETVGVTDSDLSGQKVGCFLSRGTGASVEVTNFEADTL